jgi:hypothetical protein
MQHRLPCHYFSDSHFSVLNVPFVFAGQGFGIYLGA